MEIVETSTMTVKGRVHTDKNNMPYAMFEHWGTGQYAEMEHTGTTEHFINSGYTEWLIPVNKVERTLHYPIITIKDSQFYLARGVQANHFMTDSEFKTRKENVEIVGKKITQMLKEVCK